MRLGLVDPADVRAAAAELLAGYPAVLVERLVPGAHRRAAGRACGATRCSGRCSASASAGVLTELVRDVAHLLLPSDARRDPAGAARPALRPAAHRLPRRDPPPTSTGVVDVVGQVAELVLTTPEVVELEINPLIVTADGAWACDALVITS